MSLKSYLQTRWQKIQAKRQQPPPRPKLRTRLRMNLLSIILKPILRWAWANTRSWKTTIAGIAQIAMAIAVLSGYLATPEVSDAATATTIDQLKDLLALALGSNGLAQWMTRDATVSSQDTGIRPTSTASDTDDMNFLDIGPGGRG